MPSTTICHVIGVNLLVICSTTPLESAMVTQIDLATGSEGTTGTSGSKIRTVEPRYRSFSVFPPQIPRSSFAIAICKHSSATSHRWQIDLAIAILIVRSCGLSSSDPKKIPVGTCSVLQTAKSQKSSNIEIYEPNLRQVFKKLKIIFRYWAVNTQQGFASSCQFNLDLFDRHGRELNVPKPFKQSSGSVPYRNMTI